MTSNRKNPVEEDARRVWVQRLVGQRDAGLRVLYGRLGTVTSDRKNLLAVDARSVWAERLVEKRDEGLRILYGRLARLSAAYWGVALGDNCAFYGRTLFHRAPATSIIIGERCIFRSTAWANHSGVNRPCQLSTMRPGAHLAIGHDCGLTGTVLFAGEGIVLGDRVGCGANVLIMDTEWHGMRPEERRNAGKSAPVEIGNDVYIGLNVLVLKGVRIGRGSVIGACSVVTRDIPEGVIAAGNPATVVREL